jgi:hypothetical protein
LEGLLVYGGEFTLTFPSGLVKPVRTQILAACLEVGSMDVRGPKVPGLVNKRGSKTMEAQIRPGAGRDLPFAFFVSEASVVIVGRRSE